MSVGISSPLSSVFFILLSDAFLSPATKHKVNEFSVLKIQEKTYTMIPADVHKEAEKICKNIDGSHYIVRDRRVWLKKKDEGEIELNHYKTILRDGYYFCSGNDRNSPIID